ncbi:hypothetical protein GGR54DRAFT_9116 [Hypoxylon sp. NC1633]|nr:hypothetical protein GGR54DRAFT_9116 [Hypoxylon sp. NC1633]
MARVNNEPMVSTDSVETLRRKFLRQNRELARCNSTQSLKIRSLENEVVRLLSENLDLRGQVLRLQTDLEESSAQRIADHALEIKEKMEAQLAEWGTMLAGLGHEPIPKSRSPREPKKAKQRSSIGRLSMSEWKRRESPSLMKEAEAAAIQEDRLPPIWENKTCPRETLNREEILALRSIVDDNDDSPDLGPPPVSRFVDEDPLKIDLPLRLAGTPSGYSSLENASSDLEAKRESSKPTPEVDEREDERKAETTNKEIMVNEPREATTTTVPEPKPADQAIKTGLKRKLREEDEKENAVVPKPSAQTGATTKEEKIASIKARPVNRPLKLPANRKDKRDKTTSLTTQRKPLGAKNSNEFMKSPKKTTQPAVLEEVMKEDPKPKMNSLPVEEPVEMPIPESPKRVPVAQIEVEGETLSAEPNLAVPDTPEPIQREDVRDTPPPTDISTRESSRGSRRARTAVSYAEPNLRDKMRRPSKQLLDAVAGEGKHIRRTSQSKKDELPGSSGPSSAVKSEEKPTAWKDLPTAPQSESMDASDAMVSPLARKTTSRASPSDDLPTSVVTDRRKRNSTISGATQGSSATDPESSSSSSSANSSSSRIAVGRRVDEIAVREAEVAQIFDNDGDERGADVYEFQSSSPSCSSKNARSRSHVAASEEPVKKTGGTRARLRSRRLSSMAREDLEVGGEAQQQGGRAPRQARRATMAAAKEVEGAGPDSSVSFEGDSIAPSLSSSSPTDGESTVRDRAALRRRSMML